MIKVITSKILFLLLFFYASFSLAQIAQSDSLKVATYNVGMLNRVSPVPLLEEREIIFKHAIYDFLDESNVDVLAVQEAWTWFSVEALKIAHPDYVYFDSDEDNNSIMLQHDTGLGFLVKRSLNAASFYVSNESLESYVCGFGHACDRGVQVLQMTIDNKKYFILNTHFTPIYNLQGYRAKQISDLNQLRFNIFLQYPEADVIVTGDYNISPTFGEMKEGDDGTASDWQANGDLFTRLLEGYGISLCVDTFDLAQESNLATPYTQDRERNHLTALSDSTNVEPSQRIDHMIYCSKSRISQDKILSFDHIFTERYTLPSGEYELSDHYGVMIEFSL